MKHFISKLKTQTDPLHKKLDTCLLSARIISADVDKKDYSNYLHVSLQMHHEVEWYVFPIIDKIITDSSIRKKALKIAKDIESLSIHTNVNQSFMDDHYNKKLNFNLGIMYVTEGSTLGGLYIIKNLYKVLGTTVPSAFLTTYGENTGMLWSNFLKLLENHLITLDEIQKDEIIAGAVYAFGRANHLFNYNFYKYEI